MIPDFMLAVLASSVGFPGLCSVASGRTLELEWCSPGLVDDVTISFGELDEVMFAGSVK
jgi:hypothetical protein